MPMEMAQGGFRLPAGNLSGFNQITRERERILMALLQALSPWLSERKQPKQKNRS